MKKICVGLITTCFLVTVINAQTISMTVEGVKQGAFKGESTRKGFADKMELSGYISEVSSPRDVGTGLASGKRTHQPVTILKRAGAASTQFFQAATGNETLKKVVIEIYKPDQQTGMETVAFTITLENGSVNNFKQFIGPLDNERFNPENTALYDEIKITFQKITIEYKPGNTMATDDWQSRIN